MLTAARLLKLRGLSTLEVMTALTVSTLDGSCVLTDDDATFETVGDVKLALQDRRGVHRFQLRLMLGERILEDDVTLATLGTPQPLLNLVTLPYHEDDESKQALDGAVDDGMLEEVRRLLQLPVNPNIRAKVGLASTPIFNAARNGDPTIAELLIEAKADPNAPCGYLDNDLDDIVESTPLHIAVQHPDAAVVQLLCRASADVNAVDSEGDTPFTSAAREQHYDVMRTLVAARANVDHAASQGDENLGNTALQKAAWAGDVNMLQLLLDLGADINRLDEDGYTPLAASAWVGGDGPATRMLIAARADVDSGRSPPLALAMQREDRKCAHLLVEAGATQAKARAHQGVADNPENVYFVGHQSSEEQRRAVDALIAAHNSDAEWLLWFHPGKALAVMHSVEQPPELAQPGVCYSWRRSIAHCTHGVLLKNSGRAARETTYEYMQEYIRTHGLQLTAEYLDEEMAACLRVLPDGSQARVADCPPRCDRSRSPRAVV